MTRPVTRRRPVPPHDGLPGAMHPVLKRVYAARGAVDAADVGHDLEAMHHVDTFGGTARAAGLLADAVESGQRILAVGDFDADGATAAALASLALRAMGAREAGYLVPNRFEYGYGLTPEIVELAAGRAPDLIMTVDNGISSHAGVEAAHAHGMRVVVTDHHLPPDTLPAADAIVNPNLPGEAFPGKALAGVGVAFYVLAALRTELESRGWFAGRARPRLADWLDLVALGTVADVVPFDRNNRILVAQGLKRIRARKCRPGILALLELAGRDAGECTASDLGYAVAPRLNAAGRLEDMSAGIECLLADEPGAALELARALDATNRERREIERGMHREALALVDRLPLDARDDLPAGVCLYEPGWHQGVVGIIAARVKERLHRPVVAFARTAPGELKGSARSVEGFHARDALEAIATRNPGLVERFGGHAMAAGLSLAEDDYDRFTAAFAAVARESLGPEGAERVLWTDGELEERELTLETAEVLRAGGPWGKDFPEPLFEGVFEVRSSRVVGGHHLKLGLRRPGTARTLDAIAFSPPDALLHAELRRVFLAYRPEVNVWRGMRTLQLVAEHIEAA